MIRNNNEYYQAKRRREKDDPIKRNLEKSARLELFETSPGGIALDPLAKLLVTIGSVASVGFGVWHFFVPKTWKWYSYIDVNATELVLAVRAINVFFSLSLVLLGIVNLLFIFGDKSNRYSITVMLAATSILWVTRSAFQLIYPQGSISPVLQYGMLSAFIIVSLCYIVSLSIMVSQKSVA